MKNTHAALKVVKSQTITLESLSKTMKQFKNIFSTKPKSRMKNFWNSLKRQKKIHRKFLKITVAK